MLFSFLVILISGLLLAKAASLLVQGITKIAFYLQWREFVIAFFVMAIGASLPNLFVGISSVLHGIPELSFGDVIGNSVSDLSLVPALAILIGGALGARSRLVQTSALLIIPIAILPTLLLLDGVLSRGDGIALLLCFLFYSWWLFSKRNNITPIFKDRKHSPVREFKIFLRGLFQVAAGMIILMISAEGVVRSAHALAQSIQIPLVMIGILGVGLATALPEIFFAITAARQQKNWIVLGELMGAVIVISTFVLGTVALLKPIEVGNFSPFAIGRLFLIISTLLFVIFIRTERKITRKEALMLLGLYIAFVVVQLVFGMNPQEQLLKEPLT